MKRTFAGFAAVAVLAVAPSSAVADPPSNPGCFGQYAAGSAQADGGNGAFVSGIATSPPFKGSGNATIGRDGVPLLKAFACP